METIKPNEKVILECTKFLSNIKTKRFLVAFSGGCDSSVLLHSMNSLRESNKIEIRRVSYDAGAVSYTHLTLPTNREV